jgi:hypothetical protein
MTHILTSRFRRPVLAGLGAAGLMAGLSVGLAGAASASTVTPGYGHQNQCDETLTYVQEGYYGGGQFVEVDNVCFALITHEGGYGRHNHGLEDVFYTTQRHGHERDHFVSNVRDAEVHHHY